MDAYVYFAHSSMCSLRFEETVRDDMRHSFWNLNIAFNKKKGGKQEAGLGGRMKNWIASQLSLS